LAAIRHGQNAVFAAKAARGSGALRRWFKLGGRALGPGRRRLARRSRGSSRRASPGMERSLGARSRQQYRAARAGDRRGSQRAAGARAGRRGRPNGAIRFGGVAMTPSTWPEFERAPAVAFVDVDGTLLAQTTTFLFARILYRRGWIRRSFFLRGLYHGLQHR